MPVEAQGNPLPYGRGFFGRGLGRGRGFRPGRFSTGVPGRVWFRQAYRQPAQGQPNEEDLKQQEIRQLEQELEEIKARLAELKK